MSNITLAPNAAGIATFTLASPATSTNQVLTLPDTTNTLTAQGTALTLGTAVASTSGTAIDFTGIPSWAKRVTVMFNGVSTTGTSIVQIQIGAGSIVTTGYVSQYEQGVTGGSITSGFAAAPYIGSAAISVTGIINLVSLGGNTWMQSGNVGTGSPSLTVSAGSLALSGSLDRVRITTVNGTDTFDAGSVNIMWEG